MFVLQDADLFGPDPDDGEARRAARHVVATANARQVFVHTAQSAARIAVHIEAWGTRPEFRTGWDDAIDVTFSCPSQRLVLDSPTAGIMPLRATLSASTRSGESEGELRSLALPFGSDQLAARVYAKGQDDTADDVLNAIQRGNREGSTNPDELIRHLDLQERYLVQVWPRGRPSAGSIARPRLAMAGLGQSKPQCLSLRCSSRRFTGDVNVILMFD
ncbi:hypothetical protein ACFO0M_17525 [Micromonospora mangrovi]|uniref:Uncharacterized protein n=2 Tax=Micromonospora TaxID=1873 RepID=A0AAU7MAU9_9ACTN